MQKLSPFFGGVLTALEKSTAETASLSIAISILATFYGMTIRNNSYGDLDRSIIDNKLMLTPVTTTSIIEAKQSLLPALLLEEKSDQYYVLINNQLIMASAPRRVLSTNQLAYLKFSKSWQCSAIDMPIYGSLLSMLKGVCSFFQRDIISNKLFGCMIAALSLLTSFVSGYLFSHMQTMQNPHQWIFMISFLIAFFVVNCLQYLNELKLKNLNLKLLLYTLPASGSSGACYAALDRA